MYFLTLMNSEVPIDQGTLKFIQNKTYIFSSYINRDKIIRQFIRAQKSNYNALQTTIIPLKGDTFFQKFLWQSELFKGKSFERSNQCLIALLNNANGIQSHTMEICRAAPRLKEVEKVQENIFYIRQRVKNITGKLIIANKQALFEVRCKQGQLIKVTKGLAFFIISDDCTLAVSGQIIIQSENVPGFPPNYLFGLNVTLNKYEHHSMDWHKTGNSVAAVIILAFCCAVIWVKCTFTQTEVQYNYVAPAGIELEDLELEKGVVTRGGGE